jgi:alpha-ribazole phosphatase
MINNKQQGQLWLVRHSTPDIDLRICYGKTDLNTLDTFDQEAHALLDKISEIKIDVIFSSPLYRCRKLADYIANHKKMSVKIDDRLQEMNFGDWEMKPWTAIPKNQMDNWVADPFGYAAPGGESFNDTILRTSSFFEEIKQRCIDENILLVTHAGIIRAYMVGLLGWTTKQALDYDIPFAGLCKFDFKKRTVLL